MCRVCHFLTRPTSSKNTDKLVLLAKINSPDRAAAPLLSFRIVYITFTVMDILKAIASNKYHSIELKCVLMILEKENCRASEVLSARWNDFYPHKFLILKGKKRSADIICRDTIILDMIYFNLQRLNEFIFPHVTYSQLYRVVKQNYSHLFIKFKGKTNFKVTHGFRYLNASLSNDQESVKSILHHNSKTTGIFYNPKIKK